ncbi:uncharacterized protein B0H64DRAFT_160703 [Chaetomium fimeti]|uniref:Uncharacterized protein n=1 Tax=Chaetomium fimeti TaxID=1854472 RepID=A0AAE0HGE3_9PEZI|nr:hypothetical protein B0H64DRAFT_160703 [Chaetomium fimeti]
MWSLGRKSLYLLKKPTHVTLRPTAGCRWTPRTRRRFQQRAEPGHLGHLRSQSSPLVLFRWWPATQPFPNTTWLACWCSKSLQPSCVFRSKRCSPNGIVPGTMPERRNAAAKATSCSSLEKTTSPSPTPNPPPSVGQAWVVSRLTKRQPQHGCSGLGCAGTGAGSRLRRLCLPRSRLGDLLLQPSFRGSSLVAPQLHVRRARARSQV